MPMRVINTEQMMVSRQPAPKRLVSAFAPFARSTWIHPHVPCDDFDRVCKIIWSKARETAEELGRGQSSPQRRQNEVCTTPHNKPSHLAKEQQKEADDLGLSARYEEDKQQYHVAFTLPCPYLSGPRRPHDAKHERPLRTVMEREMKRKEEEAKGKQNLGEEAGDKQRSVENSLKKIWVSRSEPQPLATNPVCESEDVRNISSSSSDKDSPSPSTEKDFPPPSTIEAGIRPCPTRPPASGRMLCQWETPLSCHPHDIPTATLASGVIAYAQALVQSKAKAPWANWKNSAPPAAPTQQEAYDLLADFPVLQLPKKPLALGLRHDGNPKTEGAKGNRGITNSPNQRQDSGAPHQRGMENVPHKVSSICADQRSALDKPLQTFGSTSPTISCEEPRANNQPPPRVAAGTDGVDVNAKTWASAAKAGMKQAAAPQEKARPCTFQQIVTINRAKVGYPAAQNVPSRGIPFYLAAAPVCYVPRPLHPNLFVRPGYPQTREHFGAQPYRAYCPPGFRYPRFPFQQGRITHPNTATCDDSQRHAKCFC